MSVMLLFLTLVCLTLLWTKYIRFNINTSKRKIVHSQSKVLKSLSFTFFLPAFTLFGLYKSVGNVKWCMEWRRKEGEVVCALCVFLHNDTVTTLGQNPLLFLCPLTPSTSVPQQFSLCILNTSTHPGSVQRLQTKACNYTSMLAEKKTKTGSGGGREVDFFSYSFTILQIFF